MPSLGVHSALPPRTSDLYLWADYAELLGLTSPDRSITQAQLIDDLSARRDTLRGSDGEDDADGPRMPEDDPRSRRTFSMKVSETFQEVGRRVFRYGDAYPFQLDSTGRELLVRDAAFSDAQLLYLQCLISANLRYVESEGNIVTSDFESLCVPIFKALMPAGAEVHPFGKTHSHRYEGVLFEKLTKLARDVKGQLLVGNENFQTRDSGDGGLDIVAWHALEDDRDGVPIAFAQCGCTASEWPLKMLEASPEKLGASLYALHPWATYYCMPLDLTSPSGQWARRSDFGRAIVLDRVRLVRLAQQYALLPACISGRNWVTTCSAAPAAPTIQ